jgi:2-keto-4-pentenoate hydratase/2-oxohepta-3-ene-1,7-dioic acid hydratase in catechol pathway
VPADPARAPRIFCIGRNYAEHIRELGDADAEHCIVFMKPYTSLVPAGQAVPIPTDRGAVHHELELVLEIGTGGRNIPAAQALMHIGAVTLGIDLTLRELQQRLKQAGSPWELCKAFDHSAPIGGRVPFHPGLDLGGIELELRVNGQLRQRGNTRDMLYPPARLIEILSRSWRLLPGDLIFTGTPPGVGPLVPGDMVEAESPQIGRFSWSIDSLSP